MEIFHSFLLLKLINISNQQQDASLNEILSKQNPTKPDEVILVKNDGILAGADGFPLNNNLLQ